MSRLTINSNIASLNAQRQLGLATNDLGTSFTRLSSGLRINKASDDAAGLSVASLLSADRRVFDQGVRNINDGISYLSIAESAVTELKSILFRIQELITQSSSGTLSNQQRTPLNEEAQALTEEYNRILTTTEFNGIKVFGENATELSVQAGYGSTGTITIAIGGNASSTESSGDGSFESQSTYNVGTDPSSVKIADFNNDGILDLVTANATSNNISVLLGNSDGTFGAQTTYSVGSAPSSVATGDLDGDGNLDIVAGNQDDGTSSVLLGNGDGTFAPQFTVISSDPISVSVVDTDNDGNLDIFSTNASSGNILTVWGNGDGTFGGWSSSVAGTGSSSLATGNFNNNAHLGAVLTNSGMSDITVIPRITAFGSSTYNVGNNPSDVVTADLNNNSDLDLVVTNQNDNNVSILLGNGDNTFQAQTTFNVGASPSSVAVGDFNNDGIVDLVTGNANSNDVSILLGNGDGTFQTQSTQNVGGNPSSVAAADFNGDGYDDIVAANQNDNTVSVLLGGADGSQEQSDESSGLQQLSGINLLTLNGAQSSQEVLDSYFKEAEEVLSAIGSGLSRFAVAAQNLQNQSENVASAASRITDVDVAEESSNLTSNRILQQAASSVLALANQQPELVLKLLSDE